jgi:hypothetical protein
MNDLARFLMPIEDCAALNALAVECAVDIDRDRSRSILDHPAAKRHWEIARALALDTNLSTSQCFKILNQLR